MILLAVSGLFALLCIVIFLNRIQRMRQFDGFTIILGMYIVIFGILPVLIYIFKDIEGYGFISDKLDFSEDGKIALLYYEFLCVIGFVSLFVGYAGRYLSRNGLLSRYDVKVTQVQRQKNGKSYEPHIEKDIICLTAWLCLFIGVVSLYLWARAYGSIFNLIQIANRVRSGRGNVQNSLAFFKRPATLVEMSAFIFFVLIVQEKRLTKRMVIYFLGFLISLVSSGLYLFASDGRLGMVLFVMGFIWAFVFLHPIRNLRKALLKTAFILVLALIALYYMDGITYYIRNGVWPADYASSSTFHMILDELMFIPVSGQLAIMSRAEGHIGFTIWDDLITGVCAWLPSSLKISGFRDVWDINTELWNVRFPISGQMPCNMISQGYYDLGIIGVILLCFGFGKVAGKFQRVLMETNMDNPFWIAVSARVMMRFVYEVPYCSIYSFVLGLFGVAVAILIYWCCKNILGLKL